jgi:transcriptional regulator with XRE-family HTH domain
MAQVIHSLTRRRPNGAAYVWLRERLIEARKAAGLTQQQLADAVGRPQSFVAKYEVGERFLDAIEYMAIAAVLKVEFRDVSKGVLAKL